ncbi:MAG: single-strand DNA-binding protein [Candidatus Tokpelaia sp. JSC188]|nr:MAG: single-strand DNA-binding protein [Candidatus Tokpelaia sp. JSC188]
MFGYLNKCEFIGRLGTDPEYKDTQKGGCIVTFRLLLSENWKDRKTGEQKERKEWIPVVIWNQIIAQSACNLLKKGSYVYISGRMQTRRWQDKNGNNCYTTEVVLQQFDGNLQILDYEDNLKNEQLS